MSDIVFVFASHDGQTRKIAKHLTSGLEERGTSVSLFDLGEERPSEAVLETACVIVALGPIRYGYPLRTVDRFLQIHEGLFSSKPLVLFLVNLVARKKEKRTPEGNVYLRRWIEKRKLSPALASAIAGKLDYPSYGWFDRFMIRFIMTLTKGPTDPKACIEFTDWAQVDELAGKVAGLVSANRD